MWNLIIQFEEVTEFEGVWEQGAEDNVVHSRKSDRKIDKTA
jgi:hypothetical protein